MQRKYEDILYNLDDENFSSHFIKEKDGMKAEIKITAEEISSKVSKGDFESYKSQTASRIASKISSSEAKSLISQEADNIKMEIMNDGVLSVFEQTENGFLLDGSLVKITGSINLMDNSNNHRASFFVSEASEGQPVVRIWTEYSAQENVFPLVLGNSNSSDSVDVYLSSFTNDNMVATRGWVNKNCTAKFG
jgi:hypothetical protein